MHGHGHGWVGGWVWACAVSVTVVYLLCVSRLVVYPSVFVLVLFVLLCRLSFCGVACGFTRLRCLYIIC